MRRAIANSVLLVTLGIFFAPALTALASPPLPMCCRRGGMHHCAVMAQMMMREQGTSLRANNPCPMQQASQIGSSVIALPVSRNLQFQLHHQFLIGISGLSIHIAPAPHAHLRGPPELLA
jgi:hypothetical protein